MKLKIDPNEISKLFADMPKMTKRATANALNFTARKANKNLKKHISERYNIPKSAMKFGKLVSIRRANAQRNIGTATIFILKQGRGLWKFGAKQVGPGVSVRIKKTTKIIKGAFISPLRKGASEQFVFIKATGDKAGKVKRRTKKGTSYDADKREIMYGPQVAQLYTNKSAEKVLLKTIEDEFQKELTRQFNEQFEKRSR